MRRTRRFGKQCPNFEFTKGRVLGSLCLRDNDERQALLIQFAERVLCALKPSNMTTHMEVFIASGQPIFLEVAARPPGAAACRAHLQGRGANYLEMDFDVQMAYPFQPPHLGVGFALWAYLPYVAGQVVACEEPPLESSFDMRWRAVVGDVSEGARNVGDYAAVVLATSNDYSKLRRDFELLRNFVGLKVEPVQRFQLESS